MVNDKYYMTLGKRGANAPCGPSWLSLEIWTLTNFDLMHTYVNGCGLISAQLMCAKGGHHVAVSILLERKYANASAIIN